MAICYLYMGNEIFFLKYGLKGSFTYDVRKILYVNGPLKQWEVVVLLLTNFRSKGPVVWDQQQLLTVNQLFGSVLTQYGLILEVDLL